MKIHNIEQRSPEWYAIRQKKLTASHAQAIAANGKGLKTYVTKLMQEYYSKAQKEHFSNKHTERGNDLEDSAAFLYQMETGLEVEKVGFVLYNDYVGCSPDLFVGQDGMAEIKCPDDKVYFQYLLDGKIDSKYMWQMQMQLLLTERKWCDYINYNPFFSKPIIIKRVIPDINSHDKLKQGFESGIEMIHEIESKMKEIL